MTIFHRYVDHHLGNGIMGESERPALFLNEEDYRRRVRTCSNCGHGPCLVEQAYGLCGACRSQVQGHFVKGTAGGPEYLEALARVVESVGAAS